MMRALIKPLSYAVAILLVGGGVGLVTRKDPADDTYRITAYFTKTIALFPNSDVDVLGVPVGKVVSVEPVGTKVEVVMEIHNEQKIPADAFAQIVPISLIADRFIQLHPPYESGPALQDGDILDTDKTQIPAELDDVFQQLKKLLDAIEPGREGEPGALGELIVQLDETLRDRENDLRGTILSASELTKTLADSQEYISGLLVNLDRLFETLASRASTIGSFNRNFAVVLTALAESRRDLEGTLANLATATEEVGRLFKRNRRTLGPDIEIAARIAATIVENRESVEESLRWLPVVAVGLLQANHPEPVMATDVRDNLLAKIECESLDILPEPIREFLAAQCRELTGTPGMATAQADPPLNCDRGVRKVVRQIRRLNRIELPSVVLEEITRPLKRHLRTLARQCREIGERLTRPGNMLDELLEDVRELAPLDGLDLTGNAAGSVVSGGDIDTAGDVSSWFKGFLGFLGWAS